MAFSLPRLPPDGGTAAERQIWWEEVVEAIEAQEATQDGLIADLAATQADLAAAQADLAAAQADIIAAQADIITSQNAANDALRNLARLTSYTQPSEVLTAFDAGASASITIQNHDRLYPGPFVADLMGIVGVTLTGRAYSTTYYVYYDDPTLSDTTPSYAATTVAKDAQMGANDGRHYLGSIATPAAAGPPTSGSGGAPPGGYGDPLP